MLQPKTSSDRLTKATIKDVARKAGVSVATVSRALNSPKLVSEPTRNQVREVARELRYVPNQSARSLSMKRTHAIGLMLPDLYAEFFSEVIRGADRTAQQNHFHLLVSSSHSNRAEIEAALNVLRGRVDGLIVMSPHIDAHALEANLPKNLPLVLLNCSIDGEPCDSINIDNAQGAYEVVSHLLSHGHKRVAIIKGTEKNLDAEQRLQGYVRALRDGAADISKKYEIGGDFTEESGRAAVDEILRLSPRPTAIFASNDSMAIGAFSALRSAGVNLPDEMAVAGFDDIPVAEFVRPALTTVRIGISQLGELGVRVLLDAIDKKNSHQKRQLILPTSLVVRESCGCKQAPVRGD